MSRRADAVAAAELEDADVSTTLRLPSSLLVRADTLAGLLPAPPGGRVSRSGVLRAALERGLTGLEVDTRRAAAPPPDLLTLATELESLRSRLAVALAVEPPPKRANLEPCNVIRPSAEHPGYCRCGHAMIEHVAVYGADGELVQLRGGDK